MGERCYTEEGFSKEYVVSELTISKRIAEYYKKERKEKPKKEMKKIELPIEEIVEKWEKGAIQEELSKEYGVSSSTINKMISEHYEMKRNNERRFKVLKSSVVIVEYLRKGLTIEQIESIALKQHIIVPQKVIEKANQKIEQLKANEKTGRKMINLPIEEIVEKWEKGATYKGLSKEYGVSLSTIKYRISKYYEKEEKEEPKRKVELPIEEIVKKWEKGATYKELSKEYGVSLSTIQYRISKYYEKEGKEKPKRRVELPIEEIVEKWEKGATYEDFSKEYGVSEHTISKKITEYYEKEGKEKPKRQSKQRINLPIEEIVKKWEKGAIQKDLSKEYGASRYTINKKISEYYEKEGKEKPKRRVELQIEEIVKKWERGPTQKELSKEYGISEPTISKKITEYYEKEGKEKPERKVELPIEEIVEKWEKGVTQKELSKEYGVSVCIINNRITEYYAKEGKERPKRQSKPKQRINLPIEEIVEKLEKGVMQKELSKEYGVPQRCISERICEYYEEKKDNEKKFKVLKSSVVIVEYLRKGLTIEQIESIALKQHIIVPQKVIEKANQQIEQLKVNELKESNER